MYVCLCNQSINLSIYQDAEKAEAMYRRALAVNPRHAYALYNLAILLEERAAQCGDTDEVRSLFERAVAVAPGDPMTLADYGRFVFLRERDSVLAERLLEKAIAIDPEYVPGCFYLGMILLTAKKQKVGCSSGRELGGVDRS